MVFDVENPWPEPVYFEAGLKTYNGTPQQPSVTRTKSWTRSAVINRVATANLDCLANASYCTSSWPYSVETKSVASASVSNLVKGTRVWSLASGNPVAVNQCSGCPANRYLIPARSGSTPTKFRVMLVASDFSALYPGDTNTDDFVEYTLGGKQLTGKLLNTFTRCTKTSSKIDINGNLTEYKCVERTVYQRYLALTKAGLTIQQIDAEVRPAATGDEHGGAACVRAAAHPSSSRTGPRPTPTPATPPGMP